MNVKKKAAKKSASRKSKIDPKLQEKLRNVARSTDAVQERRLAERLTRRVPEARERLLAMCSAPKQQSAPSIYLAHRDGATGIITNALSGPAPKGVIEKAAKLLAQTWAAFAACLTDLGEADEWRALDPKCIVEANHLLAAADRQANGTGATSEDLPPIAGSELVEIAASVFVPLLDACTKREKPPSAVADEAIETASGALRAIIRENRTLADLLGLYFDGANSVIEFARAAPSVVVTAPQAHTPIQRKASHSAEGRGPLTPLEDVVLRHLRELGCDEAGHPRAQTAPRIAIALSKKVPPVHIGDDELRRQLKQLKQRGLVENKRRVGYWAVDDATKRASDGADMTRG